MVHTHLHIQLEAFEEHLPRADLKFGGQSNTGSYWSAASMSLIHSLLVPGKVALQMNGDVITIALKNLTD